MSTPEEKPAGKRVRIGGTVFDVSGMSGQGPRPENQDAFSIDAFEQTGTLAVADGMGGERGGRIAAETALRAVMSAGPIRSQDAARHAVRAADRAVAQAAQENPAERGGMGCALALLSLAPDRGGTPGWIGAYAGDVRILSRSPDGTVRLESRDHTPAFARWEAGEIGMDEITEAEGANRLQRAVGRGGEADATWIPLRPGWTYLLVSDGVSKATRMDELGEAMTAPSADAIVDVIRRKVEERGPDDNYTAVAVRVLPREDDTEPEPAPRRQVDDTEPEPRRRNDLFNPVTPVTSPPRRSALGGLAVFFALAALALAGWALWSGSRARAETASRADLELLRVQVDSLRQRIPATPDSTAAAPDTIADSTAAAVPPTTTAAPAPRTRP